MAYPFDWFQRSKIASWISPKEPICADEVVDPERRKSSPPSSLAPMGTVSSIVFNFRGCSPLAVRLRQRSDRGLHCRPWRQGSGMSSWASVIRLWSGFLSVHLCMCQPNDQGLWGDGAWAPRSSVGWFPPLVGTRPSSSSKMKRYVFIDRLSFLQMSGFFTYKVIFLTEMNNVPVGQTGARK